MNFTIVGLKEGFAKITKKRLETNLPKKVMKHMRRSGLLIENEAKKAIQQAGILGSDVAFGTFLKKKVQEVDPNRPESIVNGIRALTGVKSRSEFNGNPTALKIWERLYDEYKTEAV